MITISNRIWPAGLLDVAINLDAAMGLALLFGLDILSAFIIGSIAYATSSSISAKMLDETKRLADPEAEFILALLILEHLLLPVLDLCLPFISSGSERPYFSQKAFLLWAS